MIISFLKWILPATALFFVAPLGNDSALDVDYKALYEGGQTYENFLADAVKRREMWLGNTEKSDVPEDLSRRAHAIRGQWKMLAVAVDACSDSANIIPYLAKLATSYDNIDLRIIDSIVGRPIMEANRTPDERAATPTIAVLNSNYEPIGFLIERPATLRDWALENKSKMTSSEFLDAKFAWYDEDRGYESMSEILHIIETTKQKKKDRD